MVRSLTPLLLSGCHLFASAEIPTTCDELSNCAAGTGGGGGGGDDTGVIDLPPPAAGIALSTIGDGQWLISAFDPPDRELSLQRGGPGSWGGEVAFSAEARRMFVAYDDEDAARVYAFGPGEDDLDVYDLPDAGPIQDLSLVQGELYALQERALTRVRAGGQTELLSEAEADLELRDLLATDDGRLYVLGTGDGGPDLYAYDPGTGEGAVVAQDFAADGSWFGGDLFWGPAGELTSCTAAGELYSVDEMLDHVDEDDYEPTLLGRLSLDMDGVLACGWDEGLGRYLLAARGAGVLTLLDGEPVTPLDLLGDPYEIRGAAFY